MEDLDKYEKIINTAWNNKEEVNPKSDKLIIEAIKETIELVDKGKIRVAEKKKNIWKGVSENKIKLVKISKSGVKVSGF